MQINITPNRQNQRVQKVPNFKGISIVQVPKKIFNNPEDLIDCTKVFDKKLSCYTNHSLKLLFAKLKGLLTLKPYKMVFLEFPSYNCTQTAMQKKGINYSRSWIIQNTGLPIKDPLNEDMHSFFVFTKEHSNKFMTFFNRAMKKVGMTSLEAVRKYPNDPKMATVYTQGKIGVEIDNNITKLISETPVKQIKIENFNEIKNIIKDLDF